MMEKRMERESIYSKMEQNMKVIMSRDIVKDMELFIMEPVILPTLDR